MSVLGVLYASLIRDSLFIVLTLTERVGQWV